MKRRMTQEEYKERQLAILDVVSGVASSAGLSYSLAFGTMIGAIRHQGFIPWDDDIDILLLREDYDKLLGLLKASPEPWLDVVDNTSGDYFFPFAKVVDNRTLVKEDDTTVQHGVWVDIFPIDRIPEGAKAQKLFLKRCEYLRALVISMNTDFSSVKLGKKRYVKRMLWLLARLWGRHNVARHYDRVVRSLDHSDSAMVACLSSAYIPREAMPLDVYLGTSPKPFEAKTYQVLDNYDSYLSQLYGDYMKLPPEDKRKTHEVEAWVLEEEKA